jgi:hypothetical protein
VCRVFVKGDELLVSVNSVATEQNNMYRASKEYQESLFTVLQNIHIENANGCVNTSAALMP